MPTILLNNLYIRSIQQKMLPIYIKNIYSTTLMIAHYTIKDYNRDKLQQIYLLPSPPPLPQSLDCPLSSADNVRVYSLHRYLQWWARAFSFLLVELFVLFNTTLALRYRAILQKYKRLGSYCATADLGCPGPFLLLKYDKWRVTLFLFYYFNKELISYSGLNIIFGGLLFLSLELYMNQIPK